jgi:uncharacterized small protein (DUF1192 family)
MARIERGGSMPNPSPHKARLAKKRRRKPGDLAAVTRVLWHAIVTAEDILNEADEADMQLRCVHALSQAAGQYAKLLEVGEYESRIAALEAEVRLAQQRPHRTP